MTLQGSLPVTKQADVISSPHGTVGGWKGRLSANHAWPCPLAVPFYSVFYTGLQASFHLKKQMLRNDVKTRTDFENQGTH